MFCTVLGVSWLRIMKSCWMPYWCNWICSVLASASVQSSVLVMAYSHTCPSRLFHVVSYIIKNRIVITSFLSPYQTQLIAEKWMQIHCWHVLKQFHMDTCFMIGTGKGEQSPDEQNIGCSITCGQHVRWSSCQGNYYCCANLEEQRSEARDDPDQHPNDRSFLVRVVSKCMTSIRHVLGYGCPSWLSVT